MLSSVVEAQTLEPDFEGTTNSGVVVEFPGANGIPDPIPAPPPAVFPTEQTESIGVTIDEMQSEIPPYAWFLGSGFECPKGSYSCLYAHFWSCENTLSQLGLR
jgi:hypothetical protein